MRKISLILLMASTLMLNACKQNPENESKGKSEESGTTSVSDVEYSDEDLESKFVGSFDMEMTTPKESKVMTMTYASNGALLAVKMNNEGQQFRMIIDPNARTMTTLMESEKKAIKMEMPKEALEKAQETNTNVKVEETNDKKVIDGYKCRKYLMTSPEGSGEFWITRNIKGNFYEMMSMSDNKNQNGWFNTQAAKGFMLEGTFTNNKSKETITMKIKNISTKMPDAANFSTEGYEVQDMSAMMNQLKDAMKNKNN